MMFCPTENLSECLAQLKNIHGNTRNVFYSKVSENKFPLVNKKINQFIATKIYLMFLRGMLPVCCCCFIVTALLFCALVGVEEAALVFKVLELLPALLASAKRGDSKMCDTIVEKQLILAQVLLLSQDKNM